MSRGKAQDAKPRGRMTAYAFFVQTCREEHKKKHPEESVIFAEFSRKCAERWKVRELFYLQIYNLPRSTAVFVHYVHGLKIKTDHCIARVFAVFLKLVFTSYIKKYPSSLDFFFLYFIRNNS